MTPPWAGIEPLRDEDVARGDPSFPALLRRARGRRIIDLDASGIDLSAAFTTEFYAPDGGPPTAIPQGRGEDWFFAMDLETDHQLLKDVHSLVTIAQPTMRLVDTAGTHLDVPFARGEWKRHPNDVVQPDGSRSGYCPPLLVAAAVTRLWQLVLEYQRAAVPVDVLAAWLHHRFIQVHPFQDGNGRVARVLTSLVLVRAGGLPYLPARSSRAAYIAALRSADAGDLVPMVEVINSAQRVVVEMRA